MKTCFALLAFLLPACATSSAPPPSTEPQPSPTEAATPAPEGHGYAPVAVADAQATEEERAACERAGGTMGPAGIAGRDHCTQNLPDAGKACAGPDDCIGECWLEVSDAQPPTPGTTAEGTCQPTDNGFGCHTLVEDGVVVGTLCVD